jgi:hypothetical protein
VGAGVEMEVGKEERKKRKERILTKKQFLLQSIRK